MELPYVLLIPPIQMSVIQEIILLYHYIHTELAHKDLPCLLYSEILYGSHFHQSDLVVVDISIVNVNLEIVFVDYSASLGEKDS